MTSVVPEGQGSPNRGGGKVPRGPSFWDASLKPDWLPSLVTAVGFRSCPGIMIWVWGSSRPSCPRRRPGQRAGIQLTAGTFLPVFLLEGSWGAGPTWIWRGWPPVLAAWPGGPGTPSLLTASWPPPLARTVAQSLLPRVTGTWSVECPFLGNAQLSQGRGCMQGASAVLGQDAAVSLEAGRSPGPWPLGPPAWPRRVPSGEPKPISAVQVLTPEMLPRARSTSEAPRQQFSNPAGL